MRDTEIHLGSFRFVLFSLAGNTVSLAWIWAISDSESLRQLKEASPCMACELGLGSYPRRRLCFGAAIFNVTFGLFLIISLYHLRPADEAVLYAPTNQSRCGLVVFLDNFFPTSWKR